MARIARRDFTLTHAALLAALIVIAHLLVPHAPAERAQQAGPAAQVLPAKADCAGLGGIANACLRPLGTDI